ncbi:hypothetical protein [Conyzicola nivalis]|nr:hypothetical protein [Conyzicola nivalis]
MKNAAKHGSRTAATGLALASVLLLGGCGAAPFLGDGAATPTPTAPGQITAVDNDLATGSVERTLAAGNISLAVNYWSDLPMDQWTAGANKPLNLSLLATLANDEGQRIYLSKVTVVAAVSGEDGSLTAPASLVDAASVAPGYQVKAPYSYSQSFVLPPLDPAATSISLAITYELLLQTTPTSAEYAKQTATDLLTIAIAP